MVGYFSKVMISIGRLLYVVYILQDALPREMCLLSINLTIMFIATFFGLSYYLIILFQIFMDIFLRVVILLLHVIAKLLLLLTR